MTANNKPVIIETIINTAALALTTFAVQAILKKEYYGFLVLLTGMILEFAKYYFRKKLKW